MFGKNVFKSISVILTLIFIAGCGYSYRSRHDEVTTASPDTTNVFVVDGKSYRCINKDGTWRCEAIADVEARVQNSVFNTKNLNARNPNPQRGNR